MPAGPKDLSKVAVRRRAREKAIRQLGHKKDGTFKVSKRNKYNAAGRWVDGRFFHSAIEATRYGQLKEMVARGMIDQLECQYPIKCVVNGVLVCTYLADFRYRVKPGQFGQRMVIEEVKGQVLDVYRIKRALIRALHPEIEIFELRLGRSRGRTSSINDYRFLTADQFGVPEKGQPQTHVKARA
jgi:hypothetical protein